MNYAINWLFLLYFVILFAERLQSLIRSAADGAAGMFQSPFSAYVNILAMLSLVATLVYMAVTQRSFFVSLFTGQGADYAGLCIAAGILLLSGMVHTEHTVGPVQFISYGALIVAMILRTVEVQGSAGRPAILWLSLAYLVAFSMAIPVMYRSALPHAAVFHVAEAVLSIVLVFAFTFMLRAVFTGCAEWLFYLAPILIALIGDAFLIFFRWNEEINWFVLIAAALSAVLWLVGRLAAGGKN